MSRKEFNIDERQSLVDVPETATSETFPLHGPTADTYDGTTRMPGARIIPLDKLKPHPKQPRRQFRQESLDELAASITEHGILEPLIVRYMADGDYFQILFGQRRYLAAQRAGLREAPCWIQEVKDESDRLAKQLVENFQREDLSPIDKALGIVELKESLGSSAAWQDVEKKLGIGETRRKQFVALLNLPEKVQYAIVALGHKRNKNQVTEKHARALLKLNKFPEKQEKLLSQIRDGNESISGDRAMEIASKWVGIGINNQPHTPYVYSIKYTSKLDLLGKLKAEVKKLQAQLKK